MLLFTGIDDVTQTGMTGICPPPALPDICPLPHSEIIKSSSPLVEIRV